MATVKRMTKCLQCGAADKETRTVSLPFIKTLTTTEGVFLRITEKDGDHTEQTILCLDCAVELLQIAYRDEQGCYARAMAAKIPGLHYMQRLSS